MNTIDTHCAARIDNVLTGANIPLMLFVLHLLRDRFIPSDNQLKYILFLFRLVLDRSGKLVPSAHLDHEESTPVLYEDEHLAIHSKQTGSLRPTMLFAFGQYEPKYDGTPFRKHIFGQYVMAGLIYMLQVYLMYMVELSAQDTIPSGFLKRTLATIDLFIPMAVIYISTLKLIVDITALKEDRTDASKATKTWLLPVFAIMILWSMSYLLCGFVLRVLSFEFQLPWAGHLMGREEDDRSLLPQVQKTLDTNDRRG